MVSIENTGCDDGGSNVFPYLMEAVSGSLPPIIDNFVSIRGKVGTTSPSLPSSLNPNSVFSILVGSRFLAIP